MLTDHGVQLVDVYVGPSGLLTGSARIAQDLREQVQSAARKQQLARKNLELKQKRQTLESEIARMRADFEMEKSSTLQAVEDMEFVESEATLAREAMGRSRNADLVRSCRNGRA